MTDQPKLLPCPFCGGGADVEQMGSGSRSMIIACTQCGCRLETGETFIGLHCSWNTRPDPEREAMARVCEAARRFTAHGRVGAMLELKEALSDLERALLKRARYERSRRRKYHWDLNEAIERLFPETKWPETRCSSGLALARLHSEAEEQCAQ